MTEPTITPATDGQIEFWRQWITSDDPSVRFSEQTVLMLIARIEADRVRIAELEAILIRAAQGHDKDWDIPDQTPEECDQCNYDGMKEALAEGRSILARNGPPLPNVEIVIGTTNRYQEMATQNPALRPGEGIGVNRSHRKELPDA